MLRKALAQGRIRWVLLGPFLGVVALLAGLAVASVDILSAVRAYVGGESLWSKGQKDAVFHLGRYIASRDPADHQRFEAALAVPLGDLRARTALEQDRPDLEAARLGFLQGGNHPDDVSGMVRLFLRFRQVSFMADAIRIWTQADQQIVELRDLAQQVRERIAAGDTASPELQALTGRLPALNERLTQLEQRFSATLGEASRSARRWVLVATAVLAAGLTAGGTFVTAHVLKLQAQAERALRESNDRWALATAAAGLGVFDWDLQSDLVTLDARAAALYALPEAGNPLPAGHLSGEAVHPEDAARLRTALRETIASPAPVRLRYRVMRGPADLRHLEMNADVRFDGQGAHMVGILRDVSDEMQAAQLQLDKEAAERAYRAKSEFLSRVSHELRTPLNAVLGFAELMHTDLAEPLTPKQDQRMQHVLAAGRHLLALINDILDLSGLDEAEGAVLPTRPVALAPVLQAALSRIEPVAHLQQVTLSAELPAPQLCVLADARRLEQVLASLLSNAVKYNRNGGAVRVSCVCDADEVLVEVSDTGAGLRTEQLGQLFQPFNRLGAEFSKVQGSGLGLVIAQQLAKRMGGSLSASSTVGVGTSLVLRLRAAGT